VNWANVYPSLNLAHGGPVSVGCIKQQLEDFVVEEELAFIPDGAGEHEFLFIEKYGLNTTDVQRLLARLYQLPAQRVSYAGLKDRQGVTRQWFSVHAGLKHAAPRIDELPVTVKVLQRLRNSRKLQRGSHRGNRFTLKVRGCAATTAQLLEQRLGLIRARGVPNYFGYQRFGRDADNLAQVARWFADPLQQPSSRTQRGLLLSSARSLIFNAVLSERVAAGNWNHILPGEVVALSGTASSFASHRAGAEELQQRLQQFDIHPTGPLWGSGEADVTGEVARLESEVAGRYREFALGLQQEGLRQERRALRLAVQNLQAGYEDGVLQLSFSLTRGAYATAVLRELVELESA